MEFIGLVIVLRISILDFISIFSAKNLMWIYYSNCFAVLLLDHTPLNLARNQRPIQIRISTMHIFRASQELLCFNTQRRLLCFWFQVLCSKPTVYIDYTKGACVGLSPFLGENSPWRNNKYLNNELAAAGPWDPPMGQLLLFSVSLWYTDKSLDGWAGGDRLYSNSTCIYQSNTFYLKTHIKYFIRKRNIDALDREKKKMYTYFNFLVIHLSTFRVRTKRNEEREAFALSHIFVVILRKFRIHF